ncbi:ADP-ribosylglycohydrolase family protein [Megasphaera paucivorans]|uniref:ADP-ribosylglycohydrolase n=1 Tax=Megasphaera paucivorans TaxID=349095 RepID=A0A1H0ATP1_9FIRM|nr:ADP-ribosylglycohydrolase family protein [Megasphaera paucivorans]SDN36848.1 ADP-ribosylglycohydrolase [Megasphaera paucivorans]
MRGAILGDIAGSLYEARSYRIKTKEFPLFSKNSRFTDDTVTTVAVADALIEAYREKKGLSIPLRKKMQYWCRKYPDAGYGPYFKKWFQTEAAKPYGSYGNGAAMRVSPVAWVGKSLPEVQYLAELTAVVTHDTQEAITGAVAVASAIYLARIKKNKDSIRSYIQQYYYPMEQSLDTIRLNYQFTSRTQESVPQGIEAFLESENVEDSIRNAISLGGDSDTQAAIAASIAEAYYGGVPHTVWQDALQRLTPELKEVLSIFEHIFKSQYSF